ncbi:hypothetical protein B4U79_08613 [Dinothrombium tinctorium]|uniref:carbonic anhydrase n=1 Tax=Dinothrombium tinctorium TaxID=1965070 RepID=A0A443QW08_9ACAR|nr:hypothetical protein B4U79_18411 [Dinothrombium tinctorium]RWS07181.1 hypothetical protein B4U79_08613 [Dinothrombium tinctorium]
MCSKGKRQSPINIPTNGSNIEIIEKALLTFCQNYFVPEANAMLINNGHTVQITLNKTTRCITLNASIFKQPIKYVLHHLHFHWGRKVYSGCEHRINDKTCDLEAHFVHYNAKYSSFEQAAAQPDGLMVIGVLFRVDKKADEKNGLPAISKRLKNVIEPNKSFKFEKPLDFAKLLRVIPMAKNVAGKMSQVAEANVPGPDFVIFNGSLTTPPCSENVIFVIFIHRLPISVSQKEPFLELKKMKDGKIVPMGDNNRATQPLGDRKIYVAKSYDFDFDKRK